MYLLTITLSKLINFILKTFRLGAGLTWPGEIALRVYPTVLRDKRLLPSKGLVFVSATNGKTTTTKLISHILRKKGFKVASNESGANLVNGILSALALSTDAFGRSRSDYGVFEVDEFTLPLVLKYITPDVLMLLNLSRDQLDRFGETDIILERWLSSLGHLPTTSTLILNKEQPRFDEVAKIFKGTCIYFEPSGGSNLSAVTKILPFLNVRAEELEGLIKDFSPAWGRGETVTHKDVEWKIYLAKNPSSFDNNLDISHEAETFLFVFNDNIPDGRDVSWIYDIDTKKLVDACRNKNIYISGKRAFDMAVRLQYAGVSVDRSHVLLDLNEAVNLIETNNKKVVAFPNYSAMLELRKILVGRSIL